MNRKKIKANKIFDGYQWLPSHTVIIYNSNGIIENIISEEDAGDDVQHIQGILSPGFINGHCHLEYSYLKDCVPLHIGLADFINHIITLRGQHTLEQQLSAIQQSYQDMYHGGIDGVGDIMNTALTKEIKKQQQISFYNFIEIFNKNPYSPKQCMQMGLEVYHSCKDELPYYHTVLTPHAPYSVSFSLWDLLIPYYKGQTISIHSQESFDEEELCLYGKGNLSHFFQKRKIEHPMHPIPAMRTIPYYIPKIKTAKRVIFVHNVETTKEDITIIKDNCADPYFCICINTNIYIQNKIPPIDLLHKSNIPIIIGTDSLSSNSCLSVLHEIRTIKKHFPHIPLENILQWATSNGASALDMHHLGVLKKGSKSGLISLSEDLNTVKRII